MLHLEITDSYNATHLTDIDELFKRTKILGTDEEKYVIEKIEQGKYKDSTHFTDRFGYDLNLDQMSTGCKAALCVLNHKDMKLDLTSCGTNAIDIILSVCKDGRIISRDRDITIQDHSIDGIIDVELDNYRFTSIERLNYYIFDERPFTPDFGREGIEPLS